MGDEDDSLALRGESAEDVGEAAPLGRGQRRGRLIQDEQACAATEQLQDLHALARADGEVLDDRVGIDGEPEAGGDVAQLGGHAADAGRHRSAPAHSQRDVLGDGHVRDEHEVLVHHPDPEFERVARAFDRDRLPVDLDRAGVRLNEAVDDVHQGRLAGAVLPEQPVDLSARDVERDVVVRCQLAEALRDAAEAEDGR